MKSWEDFAESFPEATWPTGFESSIVGHSPGGRLILVVEKILETMVESWELSYQEAVEYFEFNILGSYQGDMTPIYLYQVEAPSDDE